MKYAKRNYKRSYIQRYGTGGNIAGVSNIAGQMIAGNPYNSNGSVNDGRYITGNALSYTGQGAAFGSSFGPLGTLIGGATGLGYGLYKGITGADDLEKQRDDQLKQEDSMNAEKARIEAENQAAEAEFKKTQQDNYNKAYYSANPMYGYQNASVYAKYGGMIGCYAGNKTTKRQNSYGDGGNLNPIASDAVKAEGNTHEEGGIQIPQANAEVEDQEIIKDGQVYSDRIKLPNGNTIAKEAEMYARIKGRNEKKLDSTNYRQRNTANRTIEYADKKLDDLFQLQEDSKRNEDNQAIRRFDDGGDLNAIPYKMTAIDEEADNADLVNRFNASNTKPNTPPPNTTPASYARSPFTMNNIMQGAQYVIPYLDNAYNSNLINQTPEVPVPNKRVAYSTTAMPMKTNYDVSNDLSSAKNAYQAYNTDVNQNTNSSQIARGNKLAGYAQYLKNKSAIYQNKGNIESDLINRNNLNIQAVNNSNLQNKQNVDNQNLGLDDNYRYAKMQRADDILRRRSANVSNAVGDAMAQSQDYNNRSLDKERMILDSSMYSNAAGLARMIGTPTMDRMVGSQEDYNRIENALQSAGQTQKLQQFRQTYGGRYGKK